MTAHRLSESSPVAAQKYGWSRGLIVQAYATTSSLLRTEVCLPVAGSIFSVSLSRLFAGILNMVALLSKGGRLHHRDRAAAGMVLQGDGGHGDQAALASVAGVSVVAGTD